MRRTAVVTGGAGGIGGAIVGALREAGHDVAILDHEGEFALDLGDPEAVRDVAARLGPRDVLVHAAAAFDRAALADLDPRSLVPDDVAGLVAFLASDAAAAIAGQTLCADGGSVFA